MIEDIIVNYYDIDLEPHSRDYLQNILEGIIEILERPVNE